MSLLSSIRTGAAHLRQALSTKRLKDELVTPIVRGAGTSNNLIFSQLSLGTVTLPLLTQILRESEDGWQIDRFLNLAEMMEEKDLHYRSVLQTRKLAVSGLEVTVEAASDRRDDKKKADFVRQVLRGDFHDVLADLLDALGKGFSAVEILWSTTDARWIPERLVWRDPRYFRFSPDGSTLLLARNDRLDGGDPIPPGKFIIHRPSIKSGLPIRGGLARAAAWSYVFKTYVLKDWLGYSELYGQPVRIGKYPLGTSPAQMETLRDAVLSLGSDAAAILPDTMMIEFLEQRSTATGSALYQGFCEFLDKQVSKAVLGQTSTADAVSGQLGGQNEKEEVRQDLIRADARQLACTLNRDLVRPLIDLNFGESEHYPEIRLYIPKQEDLDGLVTALEKLVPLGLEVETAWVRDKFGIPDPDQAAPLLGVRPAVPPSEVPAAQRTAHALPAASGQGLSADQTGAVDDPDPSPVDEHTAQLQLRSRDEIAALIATIQTEVNQAPSLEALQTTLFGMYGKLDSKDLEKIMQTAYACSDLAGRFDVDQDR
jgi:phage gp29-like protein